MEKKKHNANYAKTIYLGIIVALIIIIGGISWALIGNKALSQTTILVQDLLIDKTEITANGMDFSTVTINLYNQKNNLPATDVWVGLSIDEEINQTPEFSYFGWYSPEANRSFYQTNLDGQVQFIIKSKIASNITYSIYIADPAEGNSGKYQSLNKEFVLSFK